MTTRNFVKVSLLLTIAVSAVLLAPPAAAEDDEAMLLATVVPCVWVTVSIPPEISYVENCIAAITP